MRVWSPSELRTFLSLGAGHHHGVLFRLAAMTGLRRAELCGLYWSDVDLDAARLTIRRSLTAVRGQLVEGEPKTARGRRSVDLDEATAAVLRAHRTAQLERRLLVGAAYRDRNYVFVAPDGAPWSPDTIGHAFERLVARSELPRIRFHDLRHTHASHLLAAGVNVKVVSDRLGHASVSFTLDVYGHVMPGQQASAAAAAAALVEGAGPS
jgi:integrase